MAPLCTPLPGESLPARARRYAEAAYHYPAALLLADSDAICELLIAMADTLDRSYDERQRAARLVVCGQCGHQVYSTAEAK